MKLLKGKDLIPPCQKAEQRLRGKSTLGYHDAHATQAQIYLLRNSDTPAPQVISRLAGCLQRSVALPCRVLAGGPVMEQQTDLL